jgi:hypothetical protein
MAKYIELHYGVWSRLLLNMRKYSCFFWAAHLFAVKTPHLLLECVISQTRQWYMSYFLDESCNMQRVADLVSSI